MRLFVGDDWAEDHHDVELMDAAGRVLARARLPEGVVGMARLHELTGRHLGEDSEDAEVVIGIETDRGPWVAALVAAGYRVFPVNPLQASRYRERHGVSGAKSDGADAHMLADMVRTDSHQLRPAAGDSAGADGIKVLARTHKTLIWDRTRHIQRLRHQLREYFPAALVAFEDLAAPDALELLGKAPDPARAAKLTRAQISAALKRARRRSIQGKTTAILAALRGPQLGQPPAVTAAYAATARSLIALIFPVVTGAGRVCRAIFWRRSEPALRPVGGGSTVLVGLDEGTPVPKSRFWCAVGALAGPGTGAGADVGRDGDAGRQGRIGDGLLPGGGQR